MSFRGRLGAAVAFLLAAAGAAGAGEPPHHDLSVRLDPAGRTLLASDRISVDGWGRVAIRLGPGFVVRGVSVDGRPKGASTRVDLGIPGRHLVKIDYSGVLAPLPPEPRSRESTGAVGGPEGAFLPASAGWVPEIQPGEFTYRLEVETPIPMRAVAPGRLVDERESAGVNRIRFESLRPEDGLVVAVGPYRTREVRSGPILVRTWFHPEVEDLADDHLRLTAGYLELYGAWIGAYPFPAFHVVSVPLPVGLGYPGLTFLGTEVLKLPFIRHSSLGHEVLHSWLGNGIRVDVADGNWSEGLTTFMADYTYALREGPDKARAMRLDWLRDYAALPVERDVPAVSFVTKDHDASQVIGYHKVAFFFHMLRDEIGAPAFDAGVRLLWSRLALRSAGWADLEAAFSETAGRDLGPLFAAWLRRAGAPRLGIEDAGVLEEAGGGFVVSFTLTQEEPAYALRVPLAVATEEAEERATVAFEGLRMRFRVPVRSRPVGLSVDPDFDIFRRLDPAEVPPIFRDVTLAGGAGRVVVVTRDAEGAEAARHLAERLLDAPPRFSEEPGNGPLLVIGTTTEVAAFLERHRLPSVPESLAGRGSARAWVVRADARALMGVAAENATALAALIGPLPHYGRQGYAVFEGRKVIDRGTGPVGGGPLRVDLR